MSSYIEVMKKKYLYEVGYRNKEGFRNSFNELAEKTFGINFEKWYQQGYWGNGYIPYSLLDGDKVVANVSVSIMEYLIDDKKKTYVQLGTVMTDKEYRNRGLSRKLMEKVIGEWENKCDCIYLFANDSVLNFYPKFGFKKCNEYQYSKHIINKKTKTIEKARKMNIQEKFDKDSFLQIVRDKCNLFKVNMENNMSLIMFYCMDYMKENIYYIEEYDTVAICEYDEEKLYIQDIFSTKEIDLDKIINILSLNETEKVILGFTPKNISSYEESLVNEEDTTLFIRAIEKTPFETEKLMFPILSHS